MCMIYTYIYIYIYIIISYIHICKSTIHNHACRNVTFPRNSGGTRVELAGTRVELTGTGLELVATGDGAFHSLKIMLQVQEDWKQNMAAAIAPIAMEMKPRQLSWREMFGALRDSLQSGDLVDELKPQQTAESFDAGKVV